MAAPDHDRVPMAGGACTLERPFSDPDYIVSPCAYVLGLLDEGVIDELSLRDRGLRFWVADPNLWVPFEDGTSFGQWLDDDCTQADLDALGVSAKDQKGYWAYEHLFDEIRKRLRTGERDTWIGESPSRAELEELLHGEQTMIDVVFEASIAEVLDDHFQDQRLRTRSSARASSAPGPARTTRAPRASSSCTTRATSRAAARCGATSRAAWG